MVVSEAPPAYPKLFISNGIVTRVSVWYLTFRDTRTLGELLFRDKEKGATTSRHPLGWLSPYACGNLCGWSVVMYHIDGLLSHPTTELQCSQSCFNAQCSGDSADDGILFMDPKLF